jgi:hypothetical protein
MTAYPLPRYPRGANQPRSNVMAIPKCPHCGATKFEVTEDEPLNSNYKIFIVHCISCGAPVGPMEYVVASVLLANQEKTLTQIQKSISLLDSRLQKIERAVTGRQTLR